MFPSQELLPLKIIIDCNITSPYNINTFIKKVLKILGFIIRNTANLKKNTNTLKIVFFALVRSHLEFGSIF